MRQFEPPYRDVDAVQLENYERFFRRMIERVAEDDPWSERVLAGCATYIRASDHRFPLRVQGPPGAGKTSFLFCLYWQLRISDGTAPQCLPVYIDLKHYEELAEKGPGALRDDLSLIKRTSELPNLPVAFLIDGVEEYSGPIAELETELFAIIRAAEARLVVSVGLNFHYENAFHRANLVRYENADRALSLGGLRVDDLSFDDFIDDFMAVLSAKNAPAREELIAVVRKFDLESADLRTLSMIALYARRPGFDKSRNLTEFYRQYCEQWLQTDLAPTAELAYRYSLEKEEGARDELRKSPRAWKLLHSHTTIRDFLVAEHAIKLVIQAAKVKKHTVLESISYVFPSQIARFAKQIANEQKRIQAAVLDAAANAVEAAHGRSLAWLGYLVGRIENPRLKTRAVNLLIKIRDWAVDQLKTAAPESRPQLLLIGRTAYISLMTLGREDMANEYIERMYRDSAWDAMNRAFHLEYYNDIDYTPGLELAHEDALQDFPSTAYSWAT